MTLPVIAFPDSWECPEDFSLTFDFSLGPGHPPTITIMRKSDRAICSGRLDNTAPPPTMEDLHAAMPKNPQTPEDPTAELT